VKRARHNLSNYKLATFNMGNLVPIGLTEVVRGDSIRQRTNALVRTSPLLAPVMHPVHAKIHHWFVPHRIVWSDWENFITAGPDGNNSAVHPTITLTGGAAVNSLADYFGIPTGVNNIEFSALPFRGYAKIWNEYYRDQDLQTELVISTASGADSTTNTTLQNSAWMKDYFTVSRSEPQKGPEVTIPLGTEAPVLGIGKRNQTFGGASGTVYESDGTTSNYAAAVLINDAANTNDFFVEAQTISGSDYPNIRADLTAATAASVNDLRLAMALQRFAEARSRYGSRYPEYLAYYGIRSSDARLQRPEYLGGGKETVKFSEVLQTSQAYDASDDPVGEPVGALRGHGITSMGSNSYKKFFEEDGYIISLMVVNPITMYTQGLPRTWNRRIREDYFQKELQHVGQQQVLNKEVYAAHTTPNGVWGYIDRYDDYRRIENTIAGEFRTTLDYWHMSRIFSSDPALNADFVNANPTNRIYASTATDQLQVMVRHNIQARRLVSKTGTSFIY